MSNLTYNNQLRECMVELQELMEYENPSPDSVPKGKKEQLQFFKQHYTGLYVKYLLIIQKLEECYDQILQPQKRADVREILEAIIIRFLQISDMLRRSYGMYIDLDDVLIDLKTIPDVLEIPIPNHFIEDSQQEIARRRILMNALLERHNIKDQSLIDEEQEEERYREMMTIQKAVLIIQTAERGRQARQAAKVKRDLRSQQELMQRTLESGGMPQDDAATTIKSVFKTYLAKKKFKEEALQEQLFLGMLPKPYDPKNDPKKKLENTKQKRKLIQTQNAKELEQHRVTLRQKIIAEEGPKMKEDMRDLIWEKIIQYRSAASGIPDFPTEEQGGSLAFMQERDPDELQEELNKEAAEKAKAEKEKEEKKKKSGKSSGKQKGSKKKGGEEEKKQMLTDTVDFKKQICENILKFIQKWQDKENPLDFTQKHDVQLLRSELMRGPDGIEEELRKEVDNTIREELSNLKAQIEAEKATKKKGKAKKAKKKADKKGKKKDAKKESKKDTITTDAILNELVRLEIAQNYPPVKLKDFYGVHKILGSLLKDSIAPSCGQIRMVIGEIILRMGNAVIHEKAPHIRSLLIFGPEKSGKTMLTRAIANEVGASFFNLSPEVIAGKYTKAKETAFLFKQIIECSKAMQPAIIYIDRVEEVFKKTKKKKTSGPQRIKKELQAMVKKLEPGQRILIVGNALEPWEGVGLGTFFDAMVYTGFPDYASRCDIIKKAIEKKTERPLPPDFNVQNLAHLSNGYTSGNLVRIVSRVLNERRLKKLDVKKLSVEEFVPPLCQVEPMYQKVEEKFRKWIEKLDLIHRKQTEADLVVEEPVEDKKSKTKTKKKK